MKQPSKPFSNLRLLGLILCGLVLSACANQATFRSTYEEYRNSNIDQINASRLNCAIAISPTRSYLDNLNARKLDGNEYNFGLFFRGAKAKNGDGFWLSKTPGFQPASYIMQCYSPNINYQQEIVRDCQRSYGTDCNLMWFQAYGDSVRSNHLVLNAAAEQNLENDRRRANLEQQRQTQQAAEQAYSRRRQTCLSFGFTDNSSELSTCMFELFKLEETAAQNRALISSMNQNAANQSALIQQQMEEQRFSQGMLMLQQSLQQSQQIINPPRPTITCRHNSLSNTTTCN
jgi:hypothetical protein